MKKNVFIKVFFGSVIWTAACLGLAAYAASKAEQQDPDILQKVVSKVEANSNIHVTMGDVRGRDFLPAEDTWTFATPKDQIEIITVNGDVEVTAGKAGTSLVINAKGRRHKNQAKLLSTTATQRRVSLEQPNNDGTRDLKIHVELPADYKGKLSIKTINGDMDLNDLALKELSVQSVAGDINVINGSIQKLRHNTVSGDTEIENQIRGNLELESVSGDFELKLADTDKTKFQLQSLSGEIKNAKTSDETGSSLVRIESTSGDIEIR